MDKIHLHSGEMSDAWTIDPGAKPPFLEARVLINISKYSSLMVLGWACIVDAHSFSLNMSNTLQQANFISGAILSPWDEFAYLCFDDYLLILLVSLICLLSKFWVSGEECTTLLPIWPTEILPGVRALFTYLQSAVRTGETLCLSQYLACQFWAVIQ